ncbi:MAG: cytochrome c3 family protein [Opitutaceae bacterium]
MSQRESPHANEPTRPGDSVPSARPLFSARATTLFRVALGAGAFLVGGAGYLAWAYHHSDYWNQIGFAPDQPVQFSHRHHAGELRIDCRYCHATVETSAFAGMPSTQTCLNCHSQIFTNTPMLQPVIQSAARNVPLQWSRVTHLPDHVFFDHSIHVNKGVGCTTCHGEVGHMTLMAKAEPMTMRWCLDCHRDPGPRLRPSEEIFSATSPAMSPQGTQAELMHRYDIHVANLTSCSTCHH